MSLFSFTPKVLVRRYRGSARPRAVAYSCRAAASQLRRGVRSRTTRECATSMRSRSGMSAGSPMHVTALATPLR
jgi:hypothetical protein